MTEGEFPPRIDAYLRDVLIRRAQPVLVETDREWRISRVIGDGGHYGIDAADRESGARGLADLFIGLPARGTLELPFVTLGNGVCAHLHRLDAGEGYHLLLLGAGEDVEARREQQQAAHDEALAGIEKMRAIGQLKRIRGELERERTELEDSNALKTALIATLSHDFRTPLTSIFGYLHLLERQAGLDAESVRALGAMRRNATYLLTLAENLLEYGRGESQPTLLEPGTVDLQALVSDLDAMFRPLAEDKGLAFRIEASIDPEPPAVFDELRVRQIFVNLVSNAVRYTARGAVDIRMGWHGGALEFAVRDTGLGIPDEFREVVFKPFNRGGPGGSKGAGLGLSIVRRLVRQMGGELELESNPRGGSVFRVQLPSSRGDAEPAGPPAGSGGNLAGHDVLVVDDDPDVAHLTQALLGELGLDVRLVSDAASALEEVRRKVPDVLLVDVGLPGMSGNAAVFRLRAQGYTGRIVTLSAAGSVESRDAALRAGADFYLVKPIDIAQFVRVVSDAVRGSGPGRAVTNPTPAAE